MFLIYGLVFLFLSLIAVRTQYLQYVGCFQDDPGNRVLRGKMKTFTYGLYGNNNPDTCGAFCRKNKFAFAGLENTYDCWCGNTYPTKRIPDKNCNLLCIFANALTCGSTMAASVYRTGISQSGRKTMLIQTRPDLEYIGCYNHSSETLSSLWSVAEREEKKGWAKEKFRVTPAKCSRLCSNNGFVLSGVAKGSECQCSQDVHETAERLDESNCMMPCEGNEYIRCGGTESHIISVYNKTGPQI